MAKDAVNLQDLFLNQVRKEAVPVTVYLVNGFQLKGVVKGFDNFTVVLDNEGRQMMIYKHAISTVSPSRAVNLAALVSEARKDLAPHG
ncbi:MAG: RNA chaperone Hfq [Firmicutes bacterium]|nr:RNA chaperone Hfq [Bacillota bacterium]MDI6824348.1 RNA chaperone Hfq [Bacillota bacterium]MDI7249406.1 RNA chaperone Hfq [Bacillota bacterium]